MTDLPDVNVWLALVDENHIMALSRGADFPHHLWTDSYLAALAYFRGCRIISFDSDFNRFPDLTFLHLRV